MALVKYVIFHPWKASTILVVGIILGLGSFYAYQVATALGAVASEDFNPDEARAAIEDGPEVVPQSPPPTVFDFYDDPAYDVDAELARIDEQMATIEDEVSPFNLAAFGEPIDDSVFEAYLLVGTDASGFLADTIILALQPSSGGAPIMVSLPRDLFVWDECKQTFARLNSGLGGCSSVASGSELLAIMVEDYTGIPIDHLARVNFDGFARVVDALGGITVCVDNPRRDLKSHLLLEESGCQLVGGEVALAWVRSRHAEELIDGEWRAIGGSDFGRQRAQQDVLFQLAGQAATFSSPGALTDRLAAVASSVRLDSSWSFGQAVSAAWRYRGITRDDVHRFSIDVRNYRTSYGAAVLLPSRPFWDQLDSVYDLG
ncbi:MAG TPA: LCP family protein [Acidimicrobiia bacterium]